jgi:hypothetical protein
MTAVTALGAAILIGFVFLALTWRSRVSEFDLACNAMLGACVAVNEILGGTPAGQQLNALADRYAATRPRKPDERAG